VTAKAERRVSDRPAREARHRAREAAVQMLYQWEVGRAPIAEVIDTFWTQGPAAGTLTPEPLQQFAASLASGVAGAFAEIDPMIGEAAEHWRVERMNVLDRLILRLAIYEFLYQHETPAKVVINEALELARTFSTDEAVRFINGILDAVRRRLQRD
jgi:transcription antitermination protein NusB